jgi:xylulokinase
MSLYVGVDCGTQSTKCLIYDETLRAVVGRGSAQHTLIQTHPGQAEQEPKMWLQVSGLLFIDTIDLDGL